MASGSRVAKRRRNNESGFSLGSLLLWVGLIAGLIWTWNWVDKTWIGDADSRIHIYNSLGRNVDVTLAIQKTGDDSSIKTVSLKSGKGYTFEAIHSGHYVVDVTVSNGAHQRPLEFDIRPSAVDDRDVLFDIGRQGQFHLVPLYYFPNDWSEEKKRQEAIRLDARYREYKYSNIRKKKLPVSIDYGLDQGAPTSKGGPSYVGRPRRYGFLVRMIRGAMAENEDDEEQDVYYILADRKRYQTLIRTLSN